MFERLLTESQGLRSPVAFTGSVLVHFALALILFNLALPQAGRRLGLRIVPVYVPATAIRRPGPAPRPRRALLLPSSARVLREPLPPPPTLIPPVPVSEAVRVMLPEVPRPPAPPAPPPAVDGWTTTFEPPLPQTQVTRPATVPRIGSFDSPAAPELRRAPNASVVQTGTLERPRATASSNANHVAVASAGFDAATTGNRLPEKIPPGASLPGAFGSAEVAPTHAASLVRVSKTEFSNVDARPASFARQAHADDRSAALEILDKPQPAYSEEARRLKLEGVVLLEMSFSAAGQVRVLRILRGLGHGLDENALQAAMAIRYRPAVEHGRPVDTVASVRIEFQLAY